MQRTTRAALALLCTISVAAVGCDQSVTAPVEPEATALFSTAASSASATLIECPVAQTRSVSKRIGLMGGSIELDGHRMTLPYGAVLAPTTFTLTVPKSNYVEIEIHASGLLGGTVESFDFLKPVSVQISYDRCTRNDIAHSDLTVWYIDSETDALLEHMGGTDDKAGRTVTFESDHLSAFAIAN